MKNYQLFTFLGIVLLLYSLINYYIISRLLIALPDNNQIKTAVISVYIFIGFSYIAGRFLDRVRISRFSCFLISTGSYFLAFMFYALLSVLAIDLIRLMFFIFGFNPVESFADPAMFRFGILVFVFLIISTLVIAGAVNVRNPRITKLNLSVNKKAGGLKKLRIATASDIHMGTLVGKKRTRKLVEMINSLDADIVLFAGDLVDEDINPVIHYDLGSELLNLKSKHGVYAITGNHEFIGGADAAIKYLTNHGIKILLDEVINVNGINIAGRIDRDSPRFSGKKRKSPNELLSGIHLSQPLILLDHQPYSLDQTEKAGVDLQISGHTHRGQIWPLSYITKAIFEVSMGYKQKGNTHVYVSPGYGEWGPAVRIGNRPEVVEITLNFTA